VYYSLCRRESLSACESTSDGPTETRQQQQQQTLECDRRLLSLVDEARELIMPFQFANATERVATLAQ